jgi:hypothetical protein
METVCAVVWVLGAIVYFLCLLDWIGFRRRRENYLYYLEIQIEIRLDFHFDNKLNKIASSFNLFSIFLITLPHFIL